MVVIRTSLFINCSTGLNHKGICVRICSNFSVKCEASHNNIVKVDFFLYSKSWYGARRDCNNVETVQVKKKEAVCRILRFWLIMKI